MFKIPINLQVIQFNTYGHVNDMFLQKTILLIACKMNVFRPHALFWVPRWRGEWIEAELNEWFGFSCLTFSFPLSIFAFTAVSTLSIKWPQSATVQCLENLSAGLRAAHMT